MRLSSALPRRPRLRLLGAVAIVAALLPLLMAGLTPVPTSASSHREAPLIAEDPLADGTDVYAFTSPDDASTVTLVANYVPLQLPAGGPNFYRFGDDVRYEINVDNNGDAVTDITFRFEFTTTTVNGDSFLYNDGPITYNSGSGSYDHWNRPQVYKLTVIKGGVPTVLGMSILTPPDNLGPNSTPNYDSLVTPAIKTLPLPGGAGTVTTFAGQRDDPFFVDLGRAFDLLGVNPAGGTDFVGGLSVNSLVLEVPKSYLQNGADPVIGVWSTASREGTSVLDGTGNKNSSGPWVQVSRLGMPLVNEVVVPLGKKDAWNATVLAPGSDVPFLGYVTDPELATLFHVLNIDTDAPQHGRTDLVTVFLTGIPGINQPAGFSASNASEQIRLNMSTAVSHTDPNAANRMGLLGGDADGFPNGRRLADDIVDIELQAVDGVLCQTGGPLAGGTPCRTTAVNPALGDGVNANDLPFLTSFPYLAAPRPPYGPGSTPPSVPSYNVTVSTGGTGTGSVNPGSGTYGGIVSFTAVPAADNIFTGWKVDGTFVGLANPLKLGISKNRTVEADFAPRTGFTDVPSGDPAAEAIAQLAARGFIKGTSPTTFEPTSPVLRAQAAALIGRTAGFSPLAPNLNPFPDRCDPANPANCIDDELWGYVATLAANAIAQGWNDVPTCASAGTTAPCYLPRDPVARIQLISFITRAFVAKGYWTQATVDTGIYANVPASTGERLDLVTFANNAGDLPGLPSSGDFTDFDQAGTRAFAAQVLWQAYMAYFSVNRIPFP